MAIEHIGRLIFGEKFMNNVLTHHGIPGQRWGVRRFQDKNGGLTPAGKKRYSASDNTLGKTKSIAESSSKITSEAKKINESISDMRRSATKSKDLSKMTDLELRNKVNRMNLERQYSDLSSNQTARGQSYVSGILEVAGSTLAITSSALAIALSIRQLKK